MAKITDVNNLVTNGAEAMYLLKETLKTAGWTVPSSSDGTTYNSSGDQITGFGTGANGMNNTNAWFRIQDPGTLREFTFQRTTGETVWRVKYSATSKFTGGSPGATQTPSATDEAILEGSGTDASPTGSTFFTTAGTYYWHIIAQNSIHNGVYGFWAFGTNTTTGVTRSWIISEPLLEGLSPLQDSDRSIVLSAPTATGSLNQTNLSNLTATTNRGRAWYRYGLSASSFVNYLCGIVTFSTTLGSIVANMGTNPYDGNENGLQMFIHRQSSFTTQIGYKGFSAFMRWNLGTRVYPSVINKTTDAYVCVDQVMIPWEDNTDPSV